MFTGIITDIGSIVALDKADGGDTLLAIQTRYDTGSIALGASIACSGICLTVTKLEADRFYAQASQETLDCTTLGNWQIGRKINLERALKLGDELGGHLVSGHVDAVGRLTHLTPEDESVRLTFTAPDALLPFIAAKGSIVIDGVSLTVNHTQDAQFGINIVPHTQQETTLGTLQVGDAVNIEIDMLARYVARLQQFERQE